MANQTSKQETYLKDRLAEVSCYVQRVILVTNMVVVYFSRIPIVKKKELVGIFERKLSLFMDSDTCFKSEDKELKAWTFIVTGKPVQEVHKEVSQ